jgi:hypothetical protein
MTRVLPAPSRSVARKCRRIAWPVSGWRNSACGQLLARLLEFWPWSGWVTCGPLEDLLEPGIVAQDATSPDMAES